MMINTSDKPTLYFAVYVNVAGKSTQRAAAYMRQCEAKLDHFKYTGKSEYNERYIVLPTRTRPDGIELIFPTPFLKKEDAEKLYDAYYERYQKLMSKISEL